MRKIIFCWPLSDKSLQNETSVNLEVKNVIFCLSTNMYRMFLFEYNFSTQDDYFDFYSNSNGFNYFT